MMKELTVVVNSCDKHKVAWCPFFTLLWKMWPTLDCPVVLNTETLKFEDNRVKTVNSSIKYSWSKRFYECLKRIKTEYVLVFLEDFFLENKVNEDIVKRAFKHIKKDKSIACISFMNTPDGVKESDELKGFAELNKKAKYRMNCQAGLWNKRILMKLLRSHESAWEFEVLGSKRSKRYSCRFFSILKNQEFPFDYSWGKPIYRGFWNLQAVRQVEERGGIKINIDNLPCIEDMDKLPSQPKTKKNIKNILRRIKSL